MNLLVHMDARGTSSVYPHLGIKTTYIMARWSVLFVTGDRRVAIGPAHLPDPEITVKTVTRRQDFGFQNGIDQVRPPDINEVGPLLVAGQSRADALRHDQHDRSVAEVEPIRPPDQLIFAVAHERVV